jgi:hypothetical protein
MIDQRQCIPCVLQKRTTEKPYTYSALLLESLVISLGVVESIDMKQIFDYLHSTICCDLTIDIS